MANTGQTTGKVTIQEAVDRLVDVDTTNATKISKLEEADTTNGTKISKLEGQIDDILKSIMECREQNTNATKTELQALSDKMSDKIESIYAMTTSFYDETTSKYDENKRQLDRMYNDMKINIGRIFQKLDQISAPPEQAKEQNKMETTPTTTVDDTLGRPLPATTPISGHTFQTTSSGTEPEVKHVADTPPTLPLNGVKHSIIVPPSSAAPAFYGKYTESRTQFLIRVQEYAESVHAWDQTTLVNGISQFLRDSALEWYCQLRLSHRRPKTWKEFQDLFLAQFNSPIRKARQEQEWHECKQKENETINEFLVRLRALWREQKPKENEKDLRGNIPRCSSRLDSIFWR